MGQPQLITTRKTLRLAIATSLNLLAVCGLVWHEPGAVERAHSAERAKPAVRSTVNQCDYQTV